jgi:osmotically-inducible protein OsmY
VVENISGVTAINNNIKITPTVKSVDVKKRILSAFHRSATIDADSIEIEVSGNKIILDGTVRSFAEKRDAENAAWLAPGVTKVENKLQIDPEIYA